MSVAAVVALGLALVALVAVAVLVTAAVYKRALATRYAGDQTFDAIHFATTDDGWRLPLYRYAPAAPLPPGRRPVLLVHGIATNHQSLDLDADRSLARWLHARGHDVWLLDLRGCGLARRGARPGAAPGTWTFDDLARRDAPAALRLITRVTGAAQLDFVGYSMGGIIGAALAGAPDTAPQLRSLTCLGTPLAFNAQRLLPLATRAGRAVTRALPSARRAVPLRWPARRNAWLGGRIGGPVTRVILNPANIDAPVLRLAMHEAIEDIPAGVLDQFHAWISASGTPRSRDGAIDYTARLAQARLPTLFVAGTDDRLAPPSAVAAGYRAAAGPARLRVVGASAPAALAALDLPPGDVQAVLADSDWGHGDLILARDAARLVFPLLGDFLDALAAAPDATRAADPSAAHAAEAAA